MKRKIRKGYLEESLSSSAYVLAGTGLFCLAAGIAAANLFFKRNSVTKKTKMGGRKMKELLTEYLHSENIGARVWVIPDNNLSEKDSLHTQSLKYDSICVLNPNKEDANVEVTFFYKDREPSSPFKFKICAQRVDNIKLNTLENQEELIKDTYSSSIIKSDVPVIVQYTRKNSGEPDDVLISTMAYPASKILK
jgi:hypothetical protein